MKFATFAETPGRPRLHRRPYPRQLLPRCRRAPDYPLFDAETMMFDIAGVQRFAENVLARRRFSARQAPPMRFYARHDAQARQLRMSAVSLSHGRLPFRCAAVETPDLESVVREIVEGDWQNPGYGTDPLDSLPDADPAPFALRVFVAEMGAGLV